MTKSTWMSIEISSFTCPNGTLNTLQPPSHLQALPHLSGWLPSMYSGQKSKFSETTSLPYPMYKLSENPVSSTCKIYLEPAHFHHHNCYPLRLRQRCPSPGLLRLPPNHSLHPPLLSFVLSCPPFIQIPTVSHHG